MSAESNWRKQFMCDFSVSERNVNLLERIEKYYRDTPDSMDNKAALPYWQEFQKRCTRNGYTREEINWAKRNCRQEN